jgi:hypothetical protein
MVATMARWLEGVQERAQLLVAIIVYLNRFGTLPSLWTVRPGREARVAQVMQVAVRRGSPLTATELHTLGLPTNDLPPDLYP